MQSRDEGAWWADQHGGEWSAYALWRETTADVLELILTADGVGARVYRRDDELLHLVRIAPPDASPATRRAFERAFGDDETARFGDARGDAGDRP